MAKITRQEAIDKIKEWAVFLESTDADAKGFDEAIEPLIMPVMNERLGFDETTGIFSLKLKTPIAGEKEKREIIELHELTLSEQKVVQKYKDAEGVDRAEALIARASGLALGEASKIGTRDLNAASAVMTVFFS